MLQEDMPKMVWQTHEWEYEDLPENFKKVAMAWKNLNPTWEYNYVSAAQRAEQIRASSELLYLFYGAMDKVSQADVWRYVTVFENGGFYADMDSTCVMPLDYVLSKVPDGVQLVATSQGLDGGINNANFGSIKDSVILSEIISSIMSLCQSVSMESLLDLTKEGMTFSQAIKYQLALGPGIYSSALEPFLDKVWLGYDQGVIHAREIKELNWNPRYKVDYYGESISYTDLAKRNGWSIV